MLQLFQIMTWIPLSFTHYSCCSHPVNYQNNSVFLPLFPVLCLFLRLLRLDLFEMGPCMKEAYATTGSHPGQGLNDKCGLPSQETNLAPMQKAVFKYLFNTYSGMKPSALWGRVKEESVSPNPSWPLPDRPEFQLRP